MNRNNSGSGNDKPTRDDSGRMPIDVKWDLTTAPPVFKLCEQVVKYHYLTTTSNHNNNNNNSEDVKPFLTTLVDKTSARDVTSFLTTMLRNRRTRKTRSFLKTWATDNGEKIILHLWIYGATTPFELIKLYEFSRQTVNDILTKLEGIGFIRKTITVHSGGKESYVYALTIADSQATIDAKIRHDELKKLKREEDKASKKEGRRLAAEEIRSRAEAKDRLRDTQVQTLVTQYSELYENTKKPVSFEAIQQSAKSVGLDDSLAYVDVAVALEEKGIKTGYYINGRLDPTAKIPPEILKIRKSREVKR